MELHPDAVRWAGVREGCSTCDGLIEVGESPMSRVKTYAKCPLVILSDYAKLRSNLLADSNTELPIGDIAWLTLAVDDLAREVFISKAIGVGNIVASRAGSYLNARARTPKIGSTSTVLDSTSTVLESNCVTKVDVVLSLTEGKTVQRLACALENNCSRSNKTTSEEEEEQTKAVGIRDRISELEIKISKHWNQAKLSIVPMEEVPLVQVLVNHQSSLSIRRALAACCLLGTNARYYDVTRDILQRKWYQGKHWIPADRRVDILGLFGYDMREQVPSWVLQGLVDVIRYRMDHQRPVVVTFWDTPSEPREFVEEELLRELKDHIVSDLRIGVKW